MALVSDCKDCKLLRAFVSEGDRYDGKPLYEAIVLAAKEAGLSGATVLRAVLGFGAHSKLRTAKILRLSESMPLVVEIVDDKEKIDLFLPVLDGMMDEGLVTVEKAEVIFYRHNGTK